jgi:hypothetical protein
MEKGKIMNIKKNILLYLLLSISNWSYCTTVAFEITWPKSALLMFANRTMDLSNIPGGALPQVSGYLATTDPLQMLLQRGMIAGPEGWLGYTSGRPFPSRLIYMSDVVRAARATDFENSDNLTKYVHIGGKELGIYNSVPRGSCLHCGTVTFNNIVVNALTNLWIGYNHDKNIFAHGMDYNWHTKAPYNLGTSVVHFLEHTLPGGKNGGCKSMSLVPHSSLSFYTTASENPAVTEYFIKTGSADIYLPLHMISPGSSLTNPDPNYINYGPAYSGFSATTEYTKNLGSEFIPWNDGYYPRDIPNALMGNDF